MKAAAAVFREDDLEKLTGYDKLAEEIEYRLDFCCNHDIDMVVFPALLGCLYSDGERYAADITELSKKYCDIYICPGSWYEREEGRTYHSSCLVKGGSMLMKQKQIYLARWEKAAGLSRGVKLNTVDAGGMKLGIIISTDMFYPQVSRALALSGAELVLSPAAIRGTGNISRQLSGLWQNVQANLFFGIESGFKGSFRGYEFHSRSIIHAPLEMTPEEDGFLAYEGNAGGDPVIAAELDVCKRKAAVSKFNTLAQLNIAAYKDIFQAEDEGGHHG